MLCRETIDLLKPVLLDFVRVLLVIGSRSVWPRAVRCRIDLLEFDLASGATNCASGKQAELEASMQSGRAGTLGVAGALGLLAEAHSLAEPLALGST